MKDIRVKIGRTIGDKERVALIHRHRLSSSNDLLSRDGLERSIVLESWESLPVALIVRIDKPMRLGGWATGDFESDIQHFDEYDQLIVSGPHGKQMRVTVRLPEMNKQVEGKKSDEQIKVDSILAKMHPIVAADLYYDFGDAMMTKELVGQMLSESQKRMDELKIAYEKKDWISVDEATKQVCDIFRRFVAAIEVDKKAALHSKILPWGGYKITKEQMELVSLFNINVLLSSITEKEKAQSYFNQLIYDIAGFSDELHDAIRDRKIATVPKYYDRLQSEWSRFITIKGVSQLLEEKSTVPVEGVNKSQDEQTPKIANALRVEYYETVKSAAVENEENIRTSLSVVFPLSALKDGTAIMPKPVTKHMETHGISIESIIKMLEEGTAPMILLEYEEDVESKNKNTEEINIQIKLSLE